MELVDIGHHVVHLFIGVAVLGLGLELLLHGLVAHPVGVQRLHELLHGVFFLIKDQLFDGVQGVAGVHAAHSAQHRAIFKIEPAGKHVFAHLHTVLHQGGPEHIGEQVPLVGHTHQVADLIVDGALELLEGGHPGHIAGGKPHHLLGVAAVAVVHGDVHGVGDDEKAGHLGAGHGRNIAIHTAGGAVVPGYLNGQPVGLALVGKEMDVGLIPQEGGHSQAASDALQRLEHQLLRRAGMDPDGHGVVGQVGIPGRLQQQIGQLIGGVGAVGLLSADGPVVPLGHAGVLGPVGLAGDPVDLHHLAAHDLQQLQYLVVGNLPFVNIPAVEGVHVLVKAACGGCGRGANHQEGEPEGLHRLPEAPRGLIGHFSADPSHLQQLGLPDGVVLLLGHLLCQRGVAAREADPRLEHDDNALPEAALLNGVRAVVPQVLQALARLGQDSLGALVQDAGVIHAYQRKSRP